MEYKKNDDIVVTIEDMGTGGEGIGKVRGFTFFVKDAVIGDTVEAKITKMKKGYGYARLEKVLTPSPFRVEPVCPFHRQCGGCQLQALSYEKQLEYKENKVKNNLMRIGGFSGELLERVMEPVIGMDNPFHYRNKAQYPIGTDRQGNPVVGFYAGRTHSIVPNTDCALGAPENREILECILAYMRQNGVKAYDEATGKGLMRHVLIRKSFSTGELLVCLVINGQALPRTEELLEALTQIPRMASISLCDNRENTNVILRGEILHLWGKQAIQDTIGGLTFSISPQSFYQVNPVQTEKLYGLVLEYAGLNGTETVWDLYCGIGTISLLMARRAARVYGVEAVPRAVEDARANAAKNHITNAWFFCGKAEEVIPEKYHSGKLSADVVVVDPPRSGCDRKCLETILLAHPERIVYVSCDSATLARDLRILCDEGYELKRGRTVDMFGETVHCETVVLLSHR